jgi:glucan phosphoethanolaminetransferase (alkaline phosphatase superfamily)
LGLVHQLLKKVPAWVFSFFISVYTVTILTVNYYLVVEFGEYIQPGMLTILIRDPAFVLFYAEYFLFKPSGIIVFIIFYMFLIIWKPREIIFEGHLKVKILVTILILAVSFPFFFTWAKSYNTSLNFSLLRAVYLYKDQNDFRIRLKNAGRLQVKDVKIHGLSKDASYNFLFLFVESWGKKYLSFYGSKVNGMPFLSTWIESEESRFIKFDNFFAGATSTHLSMPYLFTGVGQIENRYKLYKMPILWDWAKKADYNTIFVTSQSINWANLDNFFFNPGPDDLITAENFSDPKINDLGIDDLIAFKEFCGKIEKRKAGKPFFAVFMPNALHFPFQQKSNLLKANPSFKSRYRNALYILDEGIKLLFQALKASGQLKNTIIIFTSDHGESEEKVHSKIHRLYSMYDEIIGIPFLIRFPVSWINKNPELFSNMKSNVNTNVSQLDIAPTLVQLFNPELKNNNRGLYANFRGESLLNPVSKNRIIVVMNYSEIYHFDHYSFGLIYKNLHYIFSDLEGGQLFDREKDKNQKINIWEKTNPEQKDIFIKKIGKEKLLLDIFEKPSLTNKNNN